MAKTVVRHPSFVLMASIALLGPGLAVGPSAWVSPQAGGAGPAVDAVVRGVEVRDHAVSTDWPTFLYDPTHSSYASTTQAITPANAASLTNVWTWVPAKAPKGSGLVGKTLTSSPTVVGGVIYIGANNGSFYALDEATGAVIWSEFIGYVTNTTCSARGFSATATVTTDPVTGDLVVYVNAPSGYLYALDAATGAVDWRSVVGIPSRRKNDYYAWSSPAVAGGTVYVGITSQCDNPLVRGGVLAFDQDTGAQVGAHYNVPAGDVGGSVWSSPAIGPDGTVYITTGNGPLTDQTLGTSESVLALAPRTLALESSWQIHARSKGDLDFGASPTLFSAVLPGDTTRSELVGACNKDGVFYAWNTADLPAGPVWQLNIGPKPKHRTSQNGCTSAAAWNGTDLFIAGPKTQINGTAYLGGIRAVDAATGAVIWADGLPSKVQGSPTVNGAGVVSVATYFTSSSVTNADYLLSAGNGAMLATVSTNDSSEFPTPVFSGPYLLLATVNQGLIAYEAPAADRGQ